MLKEVLQEEINDLFINRLKENKNTEHPRRKQEFWRRKKKVK